MKAIDRHYFQIINGNTQFIIPVFQRDYSWTEDQCTQLWNDVLKSAEENSNRGHFLGSIVYIATGDTMAGFTRWLVIDGQQRLTTLTLLLIALRDHITKKEGSRRQGNPSAQQIDAYYLRNSKESGKQRPKLVLRRTDNKTLRSLIKGHDYPANHSKPIVEAYELFMSLLQDADPEAIYRGISKLVVVDVTLDRHADDPQLVFESLNSTGVDLSPADLIRNFVLMGLPESEQTHLYKEYWRKIETSFRGSIGTLNSFLRDYVALRTSATKQTKAARIYEAFRNEFPKFVQEDGGLKQTLNNLSVLAGYYAAFTLGRTTNGKLQETLTHVRHLVDIPAILVTKLYECYKDKSTLSEEEFVEALNLVESYVFRRAICGFETRGYWSVFASLAYQIDDEKPFQSLCVSFARLADNYRFPAEDEFARALSENDIYGLRVCRHLLERLENEDQREQTDTTGYSIEHIMPQNQRMSTSWRKMLGKNWQEDHGKWIHRLGNLTLTAYNSRYSDRSFADKKSIEGGFNDSAVRLNKFVREQDEWTAKQMKARGRRLTQRALQVWKNLEVEQEWLTNAVVEEKRRLAQKREVGSVEMSDDARKLFKVLRKEIYKLGEIIELAESKSISYHAPGFFVEVLPRRYELLLVLPLEYNDIDDPDEIASDAGEWKFIPNANYDGGIIAHLWDVDGVRSVMPMVRRAFDVSGR